MVEQQQQAQQLLFHHHQPQMAAAAHRPRLGSSRLGGGVRGSGGGMGEIVEVQGGHIVRSTGRKDRHSKVCTAKGPRDRRVRLSAHTAIQFYDVQDRLGYDRPSKAVDWLIKNAKAAIDELAELPPWRPTATTAAANAQQPDSSLPALPSLPNNTQDPPPPPDIPDLAGKRVVEPTAAGASSPPAAAYGYGSSSSFLPPSLESDSIADTFKFFFPIAGGAGPSSSSPSIAFQSYPQDLLSRSGGSHAQDLRLSLQSFQDQTTFLHQPPAAAAAHQHHHHANPASAEHVLFSSSSSASLAFDATAAGWSEQASRIASWNAADTGGGGSSSSGGGYLFGMMQPPPQQLPQGVPLHQVLGQGPFLTQRGPLQSNIPHPARAWNDPTAAAAAAGGHTAAMHQLGASDPTIGFNTGGFSAFRLADRIQGDEEHVGVPTKPPSNSPGSHR